ncbi:MULTISPECIES: glycosyltransferase [unclassified Sphingobacterium]|uniref:glycosyltransferase n=1 Tax=unclassified Sphingobacterium TaxID=2609468 RepID=UPI001045EAE9|nr:MULTISPECIES: glycosyltransferase [unclassified Sphingobacterium]MCS3555844.1 hypothetical protein [Sphingobacterium sp. JUb21]TCR00703.1 glycosyltransferase involved in cell wall biosynthesis [Sphingobacterium sp. JUb20]
MKNIRTLIFINHYLPGFKFGGPIRSIQAIVSKLFSNLDFSIITSDRDFGDTKPYASIQLNTWQKMNHSSIYYCHGNTLNFIKLIISECRKHDVVYLNSFFNLNFSILIILLKYLGLVRSEIIIAPRGEFNPGALKIKNKKKRFYLNVTKFFGLYKNIRWHATTEEEYNMITDIFGNHAKVILAEGMSPQVVNYDLVVNLKKQHSLRLVYLARVAQIKNLIFILKLLERNNFQGEIVLDIYGPKEDIDYFKKCEEIIQIINSKSNSICISYKGEVAYENVLSTIAFYDFYILPTLGENFGQSIADALSVGVPVIISNKTPWTNLENKGVGWDLTLEEEPFVNVLKYCIQLNHDDYNNFQLAAVKYASEFLDNQLLKNKYLSLFQD